MQSYLTMCAIINLWRKTTTTTTRRGKQSKITTKIKTILRGCQRTKVFVKLNAFDTGCIYYAAYATQYILSSRSCSVAVFGDIQLCFSCVKHFIYWRECHQHSPYRIHIEGVCVRVFMLWWMVCYCDVKTPSCCFKCFSFECLTIITVVCESVLVHVWAYLYRMPKKESCTSFEGFLVIICCCCCCFASTSVCDTRRLQNWFQHFSTKVADRRRVWSHKLWQRSEEATFSAQFNSSQTSISTILNFTRYRWAFLRVRNVSDVFMWLGPLILRKFCWERIIAWKIVYECSSSSSSLLFIIIVQLRVWISFWCFENEIQTNSRAEQ